MSFINPYIEKIQNNPHIIQEKEEAMKYQWNWKSFFWNTFPIHLEIGTWLGNFFGYLIEKNPNINLIGMEIKYKRVYKTYEKALQNWGKNFIILKRYAQEIQAIFWEEELDYTYIFFPDPWNKKDRQKKHKLLQEEFLKTLFEKTKHGWKLIFKTDHKEYFDDVLKTIENWTLWNVEKSSYDYEKEIEEFDKKALTWFEALFRGEKKKICYLKCYK